MIKKAIATLGVGAVAMTISSIEASAMEKVTINTSALNIRSGPSTSYQIISKAYKGQVVQILESSNGWHKIKLPNGTTGWGCGQYISIGETSNSEMIQNNKGKVTASPKLNIRSGTGTSYSILGKANFGEIVDIIQKSNGWYKIKLSNGTIGWGSSEYIDESTGQSSNNTTKPDTSDNTSISNQRGKIIASPRLNIRSGAGTNYSVISKVDYKEVVDLVAKSNGWYKIKLANGITGWGSSQYIVPTTEQVNNNTNNTNNNTNNTINNNTNNDINQDKTESSDRTGLINLANSLLGTPYSWGAEGLDSFDCSGFTKYVYSKAEGKSIPRVSRDQANYGVEVSKGNFEAGDLVYFDTGGNGVPSHVGIYLGDNKFIHCSGTPTNPEQVKITSLSSSYWSGVLLGARRF
ncbi:peptidoglycan endopeptidase [Romboutsia maritimum]|uniref:Peptidoglycan endopeptidase n=1 Tax=Romboutsia maritimum TaxID=2020948 RepID=A0A371IUA6_9FIRM|nr:C40 family peptidase [Romboutsia maritimum]RDY24053.1 peptidoglycan endopeptidase [Romboutsia maritimum]